MSFSAEIFGGIFADSDHSNLYTSFKDMGVGSVDLSTANDVFLLQGQAPQSSIDFDNHGTWAELQLMVVINKGPNYINVGYTDGVSGQSTTQRVVDYAVIFDVDTTDLITVSDPTAGTSEYVVLLVGRK